MLDRLLVSIRKRLPKSVRKALRLARHVFYRGQLSASIPEDLISDCRVCASRTFLISQLPRGGIVAEVGTHQGNFAEEIIRLCDPLRLHLIDIDLSFLKDSVRANPNVFVHQGNSISVMQRFPDGLFDWIYIDADHSYDAAFKDAELAATKVKPGGYLVFNDFAHADPFLGSYGVHRAVVDFAVRNRWEFVWLAYEPSALYDVALRRPTPSGDMATRY